MTIFIYCLIYCLAGFIQEVLITSYHRCVMAERNVLASFLAMLITIVSLGVVAGIIKKIIDPSVGLLTYLYIIVFAGGKGLGAYNSLIWWTKRKGRNSHKSCGQKGGCKRRN